MAKILFTASEAFPFAVSGGLGDVIGALPKTLAKIEDNDIRVILPLYGKVSPELRGEMEFLKSISVPVGWRNQYCGIFRLNKDGVTWYFIDNEYYFKRGSRLYGDYDDGERFAFFSTACLEILPHVGFYPDVIHAHDWHTALVPILYRTKYSMLPEYKGIKTVFTIHNIQYQGMFDLNRSGDLFNIPDQSAYLAEFNGGLNLMKGAVETADKVSTVSPTYAEEILYAYYAHGLEGILSRNKGKLTGILNGIDTVRYDPATDKALSHPFSRRTPAQKVKNKLDLQKDLGLPVDKDIPMIGIISRLVSHKGLDLVLRVIHDILNLPLQFVILGTGDAEYETALTNIREQYPDKMSVTIDFNSHLASRIYGSADIILMPSQSEPCGLVQMVACRYGAAPIIRRTGGLKDSVFDASLGGNGFTFDNYNAHEMLAAIERAVALYKDKKAWKTLLVRTLDCDFSWDASAVQYMEMYNELIR
ncbi:MAG: glycogen synthase GlgA [Clostridia bacterium]|nr:glycogen synthase GlgA [Clostridia bacterium]